LTKAQSANDDELIKLARKRFGYDTIAPEQRAAFDALFFSVHQGKKADYSLRGPSDDDISAGNSWDPSRTVQAAWIIWLCNDQDASKLIPAKGIEIQDAKINGEGLILLGQSFLLRIMQRSIFRQPNSGQRYSYLISKQKVRHY
jgi:hypothetical protein